jgi:hypothetical protein
MKMAICLSGHVRTFELTYIGLIENVLKKYDCDVFISTWDNIGNIRYGTHYKNGFDESDKKINIDKIKEIYKPKSILVENSLEYGKNDTRKSFDDIKTRNGTNVKFVIPMFYKIWNCNQLKKKFEEDNNIKYDLTLRCRFDVYIKNINTEMAINKTQFVPGHCGLNDMIFLGNEGYMNDVSDLYTILSPEIPFSEFENAENLLYEHIKNNKIPFNISYDCLDYLRYDLVGIYDVKGKRIGDCVQ